MGIALGVPSRLTEEDLKHMADDKKALVDVVGVKGGDLDRPIDWLQAHRGFRSV